MPVIAAPQPKSIYAQAEADSKCPLAQIGVPVFNGEKELCNTVESLLKQDYQNLEILISDNASTDGTRDVGEMLAKKHANVKYFRNPENIGSLSNFEALFFRSSGKYFIWCGHHDTFSPQFVSKAVSIMESDPNVVLCYPRSKLIKVGNPDFEYLYSFIDTRGLCKEQSFLATMWHIGPCTEFYGLYRRDALAHAMPIKRILNTDVILLGDVSAQGTFAFIPEETIFFQVNAGDIRSAVVRHGFKLYEHTGRDQYLLFSWHVLLLLLRNFNFISLAVVLPSMLLCLVRKFRWIYEEFIECEKEEARNLDVV